MTTNVTIKPSSHDVEIFMIDPKTGNPVSFGEDDAKPYQVMTKDSEARTFYVHQGQNILISEVKD